MADCFINHGDVGNVNELNVKSVTVEGKTNSDSLFKTNFPVATTRIISVSCFTHALSPNVMYANNYDNWVIFFYNAANGSFVNPNVDVSLIIYYIDES